MVQRETVHVEVNDAVIAAGDLSAIMHLISWVANIYDGPIAYEKSLESLSRPQRLLFAVRWYVYEVENGGHRQFFSNSTGIVWMDAIEGLKELDIQRGANILRIAAERTGGTPSLDPTRTRGLKSTVKGNETSSSIGSQRRLVEVSPIGGE